MFNRINLILGPESHSIGLTIVVAFLRGLLNHGNIWTVLIDSTLCGVFSLAVLHTEYFHHLFISNHDAGIFLSMVLGGVGSKYILKVMQNLFEIFISKLDKH